jgi:sulfite reductase (NADPH) hemoprotein beta-component
LRGTLADSLTDPVTGAVSASDALLTKFFGIYQQDDRDLRDERRRAKLEPRYGFMVRVRLPGGVCSPAQWLAVDGLAREYAGGTLRLTTRQTFQFHRISKRHLRAHIQRLYAAGLDTIAACGDDNRNVICAANPLQSAAHAEVSDLSRQIAERLLPRTGAYREVFLGAPPANPLLGDEEPLYGSTYLPRKFKIALAVPPQNDIDVFAHDLGFIAIVEHGVVVGYNVCVGGGMGMTHKIAATFPRLSDVIGFCRPCEVVEIAELTMGIQRDYGDRVDRSHARFKYTIEDRGTAWFCAELARRRGRRLGPSRRFQFESSADRVGWQQGSDGRWHYTLFVENGRLVDLPGRSVLNGLRAIAEVHRGMFALTTNQNVTIAGIEDDDRVAVEALLRAHCIANEASASPLRQNSMACVALPTCALAMAEAERYLPSLLGKLDSLVSAAGIRDTPIAVRMSGCPNGCPRPYLAEIALVGKAPGRYNLYLGGSARGDRLNTLYRENIAEPQILMELDALFQRYAAERVAGERFGDFTVRASIVPPMLAGRDFQR